MIGFLLAFFGAVVSVAYWGERGHYGFALSMMLIGQLALRLFGDSLRIKPPHKEKE